MIQISTFGFGNRNRCIRLVLGIHLCRLQNKILVLHIPYDIDKLLKYNLFWGGLMSSFKKIEDTNRCLYGRRKLLICGFSPQSQSKFQTILKMLGIANLPIVWINSDQINHPIEDLFALADGTGSQIASHAERAIIVAGIAESELHQMMSAHRQAGLKSTLWAALTPTSEKWTIAQLISELKAERAAMSKQKAKQ